MIKREAIERLDEAFGSRFSLGEHIHSNGKTIVFGGTLDHAEVVIKTLSTDDTFYAGTFENELALYRDFLTNPTPFSSAQVKYVSNEPPLVVMERLTGRMVADERYPVGTELSVSLMKEIFESLLQLRGYKTKSHLGRDVVLSRYHKRWDAYVERGIYFEEDRSILRYLDSLPNWTSEFNHGDPIPQNIFLTSSGVVLVDWEFSGAYVPLYDIAVLWAIASRDPQLQASIEELA